jgi:hypothetical protein
MCVALRKNNHIARDEMNGRLAVELYEAFPFGNQVENHHALGAGFEMGGRRVCVR